MTLMGENVVIVGAGRHGRNVAETFAADPTSASVVGFLDDTKNVGDLVDRLPVLGGLKKLADPRFVQSHRWHIAIGDSAARYAIATSLDALGAKFASAIHPTSVISTSAKLGRGLYLAAFTRIMIDSHVADWSLVEATAVLGADSAAGAACLVGPGCRLLGGASIGDLTLAGAGAVIGNEISVGSRCVIGANAFVHRDVPDNKKAFGVPARVSPRD